MNKYIWILLGVVLVLLGISGIWFFRYELLSFIKGVIGIILLMIGAIMLVMGLYEFGE